DLLLRARALRGAELLPAPRRPSVPGKRVRRDRHLSLAPVALLARDGTAPRPRGPTASRRRVAPRVQREARGPGRPGALRSAPGGRSLECRAFLPPSPETYGDPVTQIHDSILDAIGGTPMVRLRKIGRHTGCEM